MNAMNIRLTNSVEEVVTVLKYVFAKLLPMINKILRKNDGTKIIKYFFHSELKILFNWFNFIFF
jgi:hypothetical protein